MMPETYATPEDRARCAYYPRRFYQKPKMDQEGNSLVYPSTHPSTIWVKGKEVPNPSPDAGKPHPLAGQPIIEDWCEYAKRGDPKTAPCYSIREVSRRGLDENGNPGDTILWKVTKGPYEAWKAGQVEPEHGTALSAWSGVTPWEADRLKPLNIRTVEDIAAMNDSDADRYGMGAKALIAKAKAFIANKPAVAQAQEIEALKKQNEQMQQKMAEIMAAQNKPKNQKEAA